ncbi:MAG: FGGY-family carbohydrate kinase [Actinobacteria bacterium]|nr:FGGY-family carbohydrate kinase [Actinomycetota bacterium]
MIGSRHRPGDYVLAIDLGTGGPKVALLSPSGEILACISRCISTTFLPGGGAEQYPEEWWHAIVDATRAVLNTPGIDPKKVVGIGCTAQWSGTVACDVNGEPLRPAIIWMDSRGSANVKDQVSGFPSIMGYHIPKIIRWIHLTGGAPGISGKDPLGHILWIRQHEPVVYSRTYKFLEPIDWIDMKLTGIASASHDSICLHWVTDNRDIHNIRYSEKLLEMSGIEPSKLPGLVPSGSVMGHLSTQAATELGLPEGVPVATGSGDVHSAVIGSGAIDDFDLHLYIGTSSWISCHVPFKKTDGLHNIASIPSALSGRYLVANEHETAGACLDFLASTLLGGVDTTTANDRHHKEVKTHLGKQVSTGDRRDAVSRNADTGLVAPAPPSYTRSDLRIPKHFYEYTEQAASRAAPGSRGVVFTPWLNGERSPVDDHTIRGGFHNLSLSTTQDDMIRSVYEGVAFNSRWLLESVESFTGRRCKELTFIGGGARSRLWAQIHADILQRRVIPLHDPVLANVRGAGILAVLALGMITRDDIAGMVTRDAPLEPDSRASTTYDGIYREFVNIYRKNRKIYRRLNA